MKKILALTLAAVMAAGMTTVAFAAPDVDVRFNTNGAGDAAVIYDSDNDGELTDEGIKLLSSLDNTRLKGGTELYLLLYQYTGENSTVKITDEDDVRGYRITDNWFKGDTEKPDFATVKYSDGYQVAIKVVVPESENNVQDLIGEVSFYAKKNDSTNDAYRTAKVNVSYGYKQEAYDDPGFDYADAEIVTFKDAEGEELMDFTDIFEFEVDVTGQGKLNLKHNTKFDPEFADKYSYANIDFITFEDEPSFNKIGTVYIYADEDAFIYEVTAEGAKEIKGLEWSDEYDAWTFRTRKLTSYAISDVELDEQTVTDTDDSSSTTDGGKENPDTGR